jgi:hypothetical protein
MRTRLSELSGPICFVLGDSTQRGQGTEQQDFFKLR